MTPNIKEKVLKDVRNSGWSPDLDVGMSYVEQAIDLTLAEVGKVIDEREWVKTTCGRSTDYIEEIMFDESIEELKQKLGIK